MSKTDKQLIQVLKDLYAGKADHIKPDQRLEYATAFRERMETALTGPERGAFPPTDHTVTNPDGTKTRVDALKQHFSQSTLSEQEAITLREAFYDQNIGSIETAYPDLTKIPTETLLEIYHKNQKDLYLGGDKIKDDLPNELNLDGLNDAVLVAYTIHKIPQLRSELAPKWKARELEHKDWIATFEASGRAPVHMWDEIKDAQSEQGYMLWEQEKRAELMKAFSADTQLQTDIGKIRTAGSLQTIEDFTAELDLRASILERMRGHYQTVYDIEIPADKTHMVFVGMEELYTENILGVVSDAILDDKTVRWDTTVNYSPELEMRLGLDNKQAAQNFLSTACEELRHRVDVGLMQQWMEAANNPDLSFDDTKELHTITNIINAKFYIQNDNLFNEHEDYSDQYIEETAKDHAAEISSGVLDLQESQGQARANAQSLDPNTNVYSM